ncbi:hypothetical protein BGZ63DRAFT_418542 [Mariannaea sp. PMI_226]|nr:hypothetical protein BGZ63DRAFT_418542 [Mariannaea sp. PMI_226]
MGILHEGHSKRKINKDPNNTKWTRDTNTFGQKILRAQGWQPGQFLGAADAPHSELHTAANASYIRVVLKDDMKGLGFNRAKEDEVTGLGVFQDLLSRLNGKSESAVEEDRQARLAIKTHHYVEQRYGPMRFVRGGLLVGDEIKEEKTSEESTSETETRAENEDSEMGGVDSVIKKEKKDKKSKKRKASDDGDDTSDRESESKSKKRRKEERKMKASEDSADDSKAKKKEKKDKSRSKESAESSQDESMTKKEKSKKRKSKSKDKSQSPEESEDEQVKESKKEKKERKEKEKKEKKKRRKEESKASSSTTLDNTPAESTANTGTSTPTPATSGTSTPRGSRNFVRSRFIAQKKQAVLDTKALAQIFMVKA